jgi:type 1 glutamine amidotransferase
VPQKGLVALEKFGFEFDWIKNAYDWPAKRMAEYPVVVLTKSNNISSTDETPWMTETIQQAFVAYVQSGKGLLVLHSGTADYQNAKTLRALMGGVFREHPDQCPVRVEPLEGHPLTEGSQAFTLMDEHYLMDFDDNQADVFLVTKSVHGTQPGGWTRTVGKGRVCILTPGHNLDVWQHASYQVLMLNALRWCGKII